ncbi:Filamentation induced by cAMP protein Fic [Frankia canadensis]|uniref:Filamentation induced by cAMP protein Fic n=1 Tax=Frankia canadensis TaxID=1836972 RepID=A0A2I2L1E9_9ACTN|nr:Fic family protein [Frankia canadensis]SNQ51741.1 Filamentation induced by cAMP protein Fic [Frankia canadensis]SOU59031.1 Filamentation induced by cAMP protein Fic [Frankia canadensis]
MTWTRAEFLAAVAGSGVLSPEYADDVLVRLAHHSTAIEGNTLTLADTVTLLVDQRVPVAGTPVRDLYEVANHYEAFARVLRAVAQDEPLTTALILHLHATLMDHLAHDRGQYKTSTNIVTGASWQPTAPARVPDLMRQWADQTEWQTANLDNEALLEAVASAHIAFERIHPFSDGNGRTGRAIIAYQTIRRFGFPAIVQVTRRPAYITMLDAQDAPGLSRLLAVSLADEAARRTQA